MEKRPQRKMVIQKSDMIVLKVGTFHSARKNCSLNLCRSISHSLICDLSLLNLSAELAGIPRKRYCLKKTSQLTLLHHSVSSDSDDPKHVPVAHEGSDAPSD